jgi:hypothetical protein
VLVMHPIAGAVTAAALILPFHPDRVAVYWTRVKMVYGVAWLAICAFVFFEGETSGLLASVERAATLW